jgi:hypothetical protein
MVALLNHTKLAGNLQMNFSTLARVIYSLGVTRIPGLAILLPYDALMAMVEAVEVGVKQKLRLDWKWSDWEGFLGFLKEAADAALTPSRVDQIEAVYALLEYLTNVEDYVSKEEFLKRVEDIGADQMLPNAKINQITPAIDEESR